MEDDDDEDVELTEDDWNDPHFMVGHTLIQLLPHRLSLVDNWHQYAVR